MAGIPIPPITAPLARRLKEILSELDQQLGSVEKANIEFQRMAKAGELKDSQGQMISPATIYHHKVIEDVEGYDHVNRDLLDQIIKGKEIGV